MTSHITLRGNRDADGSLKFLKGFQDAYGMERLDLLQDWIAQLRAVYDAELGLMSSVGAPSVIAKKVKGQAEILCPYCYTTHYHGWGSGHRTAHCGGERSVRGYHLVCVENDT